MDGEEAPVWGEELTSNGLRSGRRYERTQPPSFACLCTDLPNLHAPAW
jgi:hypothetical protein